MNAQRGQIMYQGHIASIQRNQDQTVDVDESNFQNQCSCIILWWFSLISKGQQECGKLRLSFLLSNPISSHWTTLLPQRGISIVYDSKVLTLTHSTSHTQQRVILLWSHTQMLINLSGTFSLLLYTEGVSKRRQFSNNAPGSPCIFF